MFTTSNFLIVASIIFAMVNVHGGHGDHVGDVVHGGHGQDRTRGEQIMRYSNII